MLGAIVPLIMLDQYDDQNLIMMAVVPGHELDLDPAVEASRCDPSPTHFPLNGLSRAL